MKRLLERCPLLHRVARSTYLFSKRAANDLLFRLLWTNRNVAEIQGSKMYVDVFHPDASMRRTFRAYATSKVHEKSTTDLFQSIVREGDVVVDLGANIGYFTMLAAKLVGKRGRVYAFEPEPRNYRYLLRNIELNGYDNVIAIHKAVSDRSDKVKLFMCPYDTGHHTINKYDGIQAYRPTFVDEKKEFIEVDQISLDEFFQGVMTPVNVIKMDIEGAEMLALSGMSQLIEKNDTLSMFVEFFPLLISKMGQSPEEFIRRILEDFGFEVFVVKDDYSMRDRPTGSRHIRISTVGQMMDLCTGRIDHFNLYLRKGTGPAELAGTS